MHKHQHHPHNMPHLFEGRSSRFYSFFARTFFRGLYRRLAKDVAAVVPRGAKVLDIGTGPGVLLAELARRRPDLELTGVDLSPDMVAAAARNVGPQATVKVGDVTALPFDDGSFDVIVSSFSSHHWDHPEAAAPELTRVLRPGGHAYIYDFSWAPFEALGANENRTAIRTGIPFFPRCFRLTLSAG